MDHIEKALTNLRRELAEWRVAKVSGETMTPEGVTVDEEIDCLTKQIASLEGSHAFAVKSNYGRGWRVEGAPECHSFDYRTDAQSYADLRNSGVDHLTAWRKTSK